MLIFAGENQGKGEEIPPDLTDNPLWGDVAQAES